MKLVRNQGRILVSALPQESVTSNMARRVLKLIREEYDALQAVSLFDLVFHFASLTSLSRRKCLFTTPRFPKQFDLVSLNQLTFSSPTDSNWR